MSSLKYQQALTLSYTFFALKEAANQSVHLLKLLPFQLIKGSLPQLLRQRQLLAQ
jgi:hypothetical protein